MWLMGTAEAFNEIRNDLGWDKRAVHNGSCWPTVLCSGGHPNLGFHHRHSSKADRARRQLAYCLYSVLLVHLKLESKWTQGREVAQIQSTNCASKWTQGREVAQIQSTNCAYWHSKRLRACISGCPPPGSNGFGTRLGCIKSRTVTETGTYKSAYKHFEQTFYSRWFLQLER